MSCPILPSHTRWSRDISALDAVLLHWLTLGVLVLWIMPLAHWHNLWVGWLPYWLVGVPGMLLVRHLLPARRVRLNVAHRHGGRAGVAV